jgi:hypothetical protein
MHPPQLQAVLAELPAGILARQAVHGEGGGEGLLPVPWAFISAPPLFVDTLPLVMMTKSAKWLLKNQHEITRAELAAEIRNPQPHPKD